MVRADAHIALGECVPVELVFREEGEQRRMGGRRGRGTTRAVPRLEAIVEERAR